ncbi:MAG: putative baseplate assembly protein [Verrucomicrobia bacterium]|nr:putative baseplate assembly protein [Verrucomicrobiota bacterium]
MTYQCCNENRRSAVLQNPSLNGIDFLEVLDHAALPLDSPRQRTLLIHCLKAAPAGLTPDNVLISGGESVTGLQAQWVAPASTPPPGQTNAKERAYFAALPDAAQVLLVRTDRAGDFSTYTLRLVKQAASALADPFAATEVLPGFDPQLAEVNFSFKVECGPDFDCAPQPPDCPPEGPSAPVINYLAKDYGSFRTILLDRLRQLLPGWNGGTEADLGVVLAELIAYAADSLSYQQDAVATEAYLETARKRVSLRRHALLVDYHVHEGCNARTWLQLQVAGNPGTPVFLDRALTRFYTFAPGMPSSLAVGSGNEETALLRGVQVFEPMCDAILYPEQNQLRFYTWGNANCCLPKGATEASLLGSFPNLRPGDVLIFQEIKGPQTGNAADADVRHRWAVRLTQVVTLVDPLYEDKTGKVIVNNSQTPTPVTEIQWAAHDALPFPLCLSSTYLDANGDAQTVTDVTVAFGNVVLADHGLSFSGKSLGTVPAPRLYQPPDPAVDRCQLAPRTPLPVRFRPEVPDRPLTQAMPLPTVSLPGSGNPVTTGAVAFPATGPLVLADASGFATVTLPPSNPSGWPRCFGVIATPNTVHPANLDLRVVYNPPGGAAGIQAKVTVEAFVNVSLNPADPNYAATQLNAQSRLLRVPVSYQPPTGPPAGLPSAPTMFSSAGTLTLLDLAAQPVLSLEVTDPVAWPPAFGVAAQPNAQDPTRFDLRILYNPSTGGLGVTLPVTLEQFLALMPATAAATINSQSALVTMDSFAQTADPALSAADLIATDPGDAVPCITLEGTLNSLTTTWTPRQDLLESGESDPNFVVEVESDGVATLRFGDDTNARSPDTGTVFTASYRIGNGAAGNVGADSLVYLAAADARIQSCRNPLPASGGTDPETNEQIRRRAPQAFLTQERAVTMQDYAAVTDLNPRVAQSVATLRWTGSWCTVFVAIDPKGGGTLKPDLEPALLANLERYRLAGQDLELDSPDYVSLEIELEVCVDPDFFQRDVERALLQGLGDRVLSNGQKGIFHPDNFTFGQTVYLSQVYAAARSVAGVVSVAATKFQPQGVDTGVFLAAGAIQLGPLQVARLENDPNFPAHGQLTLVMEGGK